MRALLLLVGFGLVFHSATAHAFGSAPSHPQPVPTSTPQPTPVPTPTPTASPQVISGWLDSYSQFVETRVSDRYPELLSLASWRMQTVCPTWDSLSRDEREKFWSALLDSIAGAESSWNRTSIYVESTMDIDSVTGQQIRSEGLLQLSYSDIPNYGYPDSDISWRNDEAMALADYNSGVTSGNPDRSILNAYSNLSLGLWIMDKQLSKLNPNESLEDALGNYWFTMKSQYRPFSEVMDQLRATAPSCFN